MAKAKIVKSEEVAFKKIQGLGGEWKRLISDTDRGMIVGIGILRPGEKARHSHPEEEAFYVIFGKGIARWWEDGVMKEAELYPGVLFYKAPNVEHMMENTGKDPMIGVLCKV